MQQPLRPAKAGLRLARAGVLAVAGTALAEAAHALTAGCTELLGLSLVLAACLPASWVLSARQRSAAVLLGWLACVQVAAHLILTGTCGDRLLDRSLGALALHAAAVLLTAGCLHAADAALWAAGRLGKATRLALRLLVGGPVNVEAPAGLAGTLRSRPIVHICLNFRSPRVRRGPPGAVYASC